MCRIICIPAAAPDTSAMRRHVRVRTYNIHVHIHECACALHLRLHLGRDAPPSAAQIMRAVRHRQTARHRQRRDAPYRDAACAPQRAAVVGRSLYMYVRSQFSFQFSFYPAAIQLTVVAILHRTDVFCVRLEGHCREFGVKPCSNGAYFSIRRSPCTV